MTVHALFPAPNSRASRRAIADEIERLIAMLDLFDGDCDLEDDDPAGDPLDFGEAQDASAIMPTQPIYGIDQTKGPINEREAVIAFNRAQMETH